MKRFLSIAVCFILLFGTLAFGGEGFIELVKEMSVNAEATTYKTGDIISFGSYPQGKVTDSSLIKNLNSLAGDNKKWTSYGYYSGNVYNENWYNDFNGQIELSNYMRYKDVKYDENKYRGVIFDSYRSECTNYTLSENNSVQDDNGYTTRTVYWFKYEPIKWKVLDPSTCLVMCATAIDSQAFNNYVWIGIGSKSTEKEYYGDTAHTYYASDYAKSSIRQWLNNDFYYTAFSTEQQNIIKTTTLDNSSAFDSKYDSATTNDKIFLLSYSDSVNSSYGFDEEYLYTEKAGLLVSSDYAKCQGCRTCYDSRYIGSCWWWLRSSSWSGSAFGAGQDVDLGHLDYRTDITCAGVVPALKLQNLNLESLEKDNSKNSNDGTLSKKQSDSLDNKPSESSKTDETIEIVVDDKTDDIVINKNITESSETTTKNETESTSSEGTSSASAAPTQNSRASNIKIVILTVIFCALVAAVILIVRSILKDKKETRQ